MITSKNQELQLSSLVDTSRPRLILTDAKRYFKLCYPGADFSLVEASFTQAKRLYDGRFPGYHACAVEYHGYAHACSVFAATSRLIDGCELSGLSIGQASACDILVAALLHDVGYIREEGDDSGSGAQYTKIHVDRSAAFVRRQSAAFGLSEAHAKRIARMILGTDLGRDWESIDFEDDEERLGSQIVAAADLIGQMSDRAYLERLLFLFYEFVEAGIGGYESAFDILRKTAAFYTDIKARLDGTLARVSNRTHMHFSKRFGIDRDLYREAIDHQMRYLDSIIADDSSNFRKKLKRMDLASIESRRA